MPAAERSVYAPWDKMDDFLTYALGEMKSAIDRLSVYAARLDRQLAVEPGTDALREMVREVRGQAELVAKQQALFNKSRLKMAEALRPTSQPATSTESATHPLQGDAKRLKVTNAPVPPPDSFLSR